MVTDPSHIHPAASHTRPAVIAAGRIHLDADHIETVEQSIDRAQRAEKTAK
jgi:hypothetical protein